MVSPSDVVSSGKYFFWQFDFATLCLVAEITIQARATAKAAQVASECNWT
jgi:hypothetical protein